MGLSVDIEKALGGFRLSVQLEAENGSSLALLGASGSGKSVTLKCIAGLMRPDAGQILLDDVPLFDSERGIDVPPQRRHIGYLFQRYALFPDMTVRQNIAAGARDRKEEQIQADDFIRRFRLEDVADKRPRQISGGQQQRTALARILASQPSVILLDEPFSSLDLWLRARMEAELAQCLSGFEGPLIWVSHDRGEVYRNCRDVCVIDEGRSQDPSTVAALFSQPRTESAARLAGCSNFADAIPRENAVFLPQWGVTLRCAYPLPPFLWRVGIWARDVRPTEPGTANAFTVDVVRAVEDVSSTDVQLRPVGAAPDAPILHMELEKGLWQSLPDRRRLTVAVSPQAILLLR